MFAHVFARDGAASSIRANRLLRLFAALACSSFLLLAVFMVCLPLAGFIAHTAPDDAFYYLEIARRFGDSGWPTFDGQHTTTGFHPLWQLLLVPLASMGSPWLFARITVAISALFMFGAAIQLTRLVARTEGPVSAVVVWIFVVGAMGICRFGLNGMETPLGLFLLSSWSLEALRPEPRSARAGLLAALTVLARIDLVMPIAIGHAWLLLRDRKNLRPWIASMAISAAVLLPFVVWNLLHTGHAGTISAATKLYAVEEHVNATFGGKASMGFLAYAIKDFVANVATVAIHIWGRGLVYAPIGMVTGDYPLAVELRSHALMVVPGALALVAFGLFLVRRIDASEWVADVASPDRSFLLWVFAGGSLVHMVTCSLLLPRQTGGWYWGVEIGALAILCGRTFARHARARKPLVALALANTAASIIVVVITGMTIVRGRFDERTSFGSAAIAVAQYLDRHTEPGAMAASRNGGIIGFVANRPVVNLDGLVNDWDYLEARRRGESRSYIQRQGIRYYGDCVVPGEQSEYAKELGLAPNEVTTVFRVDGRICEGFVWRIDLPADSPTTTSSLELVPTP